MLIKMIGTLKRYNKRADSHQRNLLFISLVNCLGFSLLQAPSRLPSARCASIAYIFS